MPLASEVPSVEGRAGREQPYMPKPDHPASPTLQATIEVLTPRPLVSVNTFSHAANDIFSLARSGGLQALVVSGPRPHHQRFLRRALECSHTKQRIPHDINRSRPWPAPVRQPSFGEIVMIYDGEIARGLESLLPSAQSSSQVQTRAQPGARQTDSRLARGCYLFLFLDATLTFRRRQVHGRRRRRRRRKELVGKASKE